MSSVLEPNSLLHDPFEASQFLQSVSSTPSQFVDKAVQNGQLKEMAY